MISKSGSSKDIEFHPDAWARFERAAGVVAKTPPQHRVKEKPKVKKAERPKPKPKKPSSP